MLPLVLHYIADPDFHSLLDILINFVIMLFNKEFVSVESSTYL